MNKKNLKNICDKLLETFFSAGELSLTLRSKGLITEYKEDNTPVSNGDIEVNKIITSKIKNLTPDMPIVSEESSENKNNTKLKDFWLIDPIDGTYDYVNNKDEFTLNAGLILDKKPVLGLIYAPAKKRMFYTYDLGESYEIFNNKKVKLDCSKKTKVNQIKAIHYSNKLHPIIDNYHKKFGVTEFTRMKSSLKFCVIATS